jgi:hypothetical protein
MEENVLNAIIIHSKKTENKCGLSIPDLSSMLDTDIKTLKEILLKLYREKKITIREGINSKLIFSK